MITVLVIEPSPARGQLLSDILDSEADIQVAALAGNGREAMLLLRKLKPHVILVAADLPPDDGCQTTREIMIEYPTPVIIMTSHQGAQQPEKGPAALTAGAMALAVYPEPDATSYAAMKAGFLDAVRLFAQVRPVRQYRQKHRHPTHHSALDGTITGRIIAIAASTGGPKALAYILARLPATYPFPILIVQHMSTGFSASFVHWLDSTTPLTVRLARHNEPLMPATVYLADNSHHLEVSTSHRLRLSATPPEQGFRPSANRLFRSVAEAHQQQVVAVMLTGMGSDGVDGLTAVRRSGGYILAQDETSSTVFGMPKAAIDARLPHAVLNLHEISDYLRYLAV